MYIKTCPSCNCEITYKHKDSLNYSIKNNICCRKCMGKKISKMKKGVALSESHKKKLSDAKIGVKLSDSHKGNIGKSNKGLIRSDEAKMNYSISKMGNKNPVKKQQIKDKIRNSIIDKYKLDPSIKKEFLIH